MGFRLLSQVSPSSSTLSCLLPVFDFQLFLDLPWLLAIVVLVFLLVWFPCFQSSSFLVDLAWSIRCICPSHLILCALMNLTISATSIKLSISMLRCILHILSILTGPNIFLNKKWKTNWCHCFTFIHISTDLYMFRAHRAIFRRIHTALFTTIGYWWCNK